MIHNRSRPNGMRAAIAAAAARIMAESGIDDFALAKRKAARQLGAIGARNLPGNDEIEVQLRAYRALYQTTEHPDRIRELRMLAMSIMRELAPFNPYLIGPVLKGIAGPYADIELQLFPDSAKQVEIFLLNRNIPFGLSEARRYSGDQAHSATVLELDWHGAPVKLSVFDCRDERIALKTSQAGRTIERAGIAEVSALVQASDA